jgi:hypothetical protein
MSVTRGSTSLHPERFALTAVAKHPCPPLTAWLATMSQAEAVANQIEAQRVAEAVAKGQVRAVGPARLWLQLRTSIDFAHGGSRCGVVSARPSAPATAHCN